MTFIDFFAGFGGFRLGMEAAGHKCIGFCEIDKHAVRTYQAMHLTTAAEKETLLKCKDYREGQKYIQGIDFSAREWYADDIRRVHADDIPRADIWCAGFPCQDVSVAGQGKGFTGERSSLFFAITGLIRDLKEKDRPCYILLENVKGLFSVNRGWDFARIQIELDEIGYDAQWQAINTADYLPQNRERIFIVGYLRGRGRTEIFPLKGPGPENYLE